jgi:hypothetical protein
MKFILILILGVNISFGQTKWNSKKYGYQVEIPEGFKTVKATGVNVDFKAVNSGKSIIIVVKKLSEEDQKLTIWQGLGDLDEYAHVFQTSLEEFTNSPIIIKYGKTKINNKDAFWIDYTSDNGTYYYKNYSLKKGPYIFTITIFSDTHSWNYYSAIWFRFKEQIKF